MVPSQLSKLARKHQCTELKSVWHFRACFLFRPVVSSSFQIAPILLLLQWIRMPFIIISFYFVALLKLQDNDGFSFLFDESLFPKSAAILLPLSGWCWLRKNILQSRSHRKNKISGSEGTVTFLNFYSKRFWIHAFVH